MRADYAQLLRAQRRRNKLATLRLRVVRSSTGSLHSGFTDKVIERFREEGPGKRLKECFRLTHKKGGVSSAARQIDALLAKTNREREQSPRAHAERLKGNDLAYSPIHPGEHRDRLAKAQRLMAEHDVDALVLTAGTSLRYFTGLVWGLSERLLAAVLPRAGGPTFVVPAFEEPKVRELLVVEGDLRGWEEHENPYGVVASLLKESSASSGVVGLDPTAPYFAAEGLREAAGGWRLVPAAPIIDACRMHKSAAEVALIRHAMGVTLDIHKRCRDQLRQGITNTELVAWIDQQHQAAGSDTGSTFAIVAFGESTAFPHGPDGEQTLREGDTVLVDTGCTFCGYHSDLTRTYVFGEPTARQRELWEIEHEAQAAAFGAAQLGAPCEAVDSAARAVMVRRGLGPGYQTPGLPHRTGHGLGMDIHEPPYLVRGNAAPLAAGMVASIEPMIVSYSEMGVRLEDHFLMTASGPEWLSEPAPSLDRPFG